MRGQTSYHSEIFYLNFNEYVYQNGYFSDCTQSFLLSISSEKKFVSKCDTINWHIEVTLEECFVKACLGMGTIVNFRSGVCSVGKCIGEDFKLQGDDPGWDIYIFSGLKLSILYI